MCNLTLFYIDTFKNYPFQLYKKAYFPSNSQLGNKTSEATQDEAEKGAAVSGLSSEESDDDLLESVERQAVYNEHNTKPESAA